MSPQPGGYLTPKLTIPRIWQSFIPLSSYGVFQRGGYFVVDVIPDRLAVISLNTIYFYDSNKGESGYPTAVFVISARSSAPEALGWMPVGLPISCPMTFRLILLTEGVFRSWSPGSLVRLISAPIKYPFLLMICTAQLWEGVNTHNPTTLATSSWTGWTCNSAYSETKGSV